MIDYYESIETSILIMKKEMREFYNKIQTDTDIKFKKVVIMDAQMDMLQKEQENYRNKRTKEKA